MSLGIIIYPFDAEYPGEISVEENQTVYITQQHEDGWTTVRINGEHDDEHEGLVPTSYIKILNTERRLPPKPPRKHSSVSRLSSLGVNLNGYNEALLNSDYVEKEPSPSLDAKKPAISESQWRQSVKLALSQSSSDRQSIQFLTNVLSKQLKLQSSQQNSLENVNTKDLRVIEKAIVANQRKRKWKEFWSKDDKFKKRRTRIALIKETVATEETYVNNLKLCLRVFGQLKGSEVLLKGIQEIIQVNEELLAKMKLELENFPMTFLGRVFKEMTSKMVVYTDFINNYDKSFELYQQWILSNKKSFATQLNKIYKKYQSELGGKQLESYLILPVQRIPRYRMLLESILKHTNETHVEYQDIKDALEDIMQLANFIDDQKKLTEDSDAKVTLTRIINEYSIYKGIAHNNRRLIRDGVLTISCPSRNIPGTGTKFKCYLMSDLLVFTDVIDPNLKKKNGRVEFVFMFVSKIVDETSTSFTLETFHQSESIRIVFSSEIQGDCSMWCKDIRSTLDSCEALYRLYESEDDLTKLASERILLQDASKESMKQYSELKIQYSAHDRECLYLQQRVLEHEEELRCLQELIRQEKIELEEMSTRKEAIRKECEYYGERISQCIFTIRERDQIFLTLLRNETDSFRIIFDDQPSDTGVVDSPSRNSNSYQSYANDPRSRSASTSTSSTLTIRM